MASQGYRDWLGAGKPYALIRPAAAVQATLSGYGLTVYDYPNDAHLQANTPEDHTPFSVTGWPGTNKRWHARALDVMPRADVPAAQARKENADIARQLIRDRSAGYAGAAWIKYVNWTDENGYCEQVRWTDAGQPNRAVTRGSSDKGHIHISGRSDSDNDDRADRYDPIARMRGLTEEDDMQLSEKSPWSTQFTAEDGVPGPWLGGTVGNQLQYVREDTHFTRALIERLLGAAAADEVRDTAMTAAITGLVEAFRAANGSPITDVSVERIIGAVRDATSETHGYITQLQAEGADLRARLAAALGSGSE